MKRMGNAGRPSDDTYKNLLSDFTGQLVFIMGCHRSGTSLLYHLLAYTGAYNYVSAYDSICYNELIQNPQTCFADPELRGGRSVVNALRIPMPRSGNFADVYEFFGASCSRWAIKCFTRQIPGLRERYRDYVWADRAATR